MRSRLMLKLLILVFTVLFVQALILPTAPTSAANVVNYTFHVTATAIPNPCYPIDVINLNGDIHIVITYTGDNKGGYHMSSSLNYQGVSGQSITTQTLYQSSTITNNNFNMNPPFPSTYSNIDSWSLISQGGTDNFIMHSTFHVTMNANGVPTATVDNFSAQCNG